jgi:hypothetical protein
LVNNLGLIRTNFVSNQNYINNLVVEIFVCEKISIWFRIM